MSPIPGLDKIYVLTCKKGYEDRQRWVEAQLGRRGLSFEYVLDFDAPELTPEICQRYFAAELRPGSMSVSIKHFEAMRRARDAGFERTLIFEDDVCLFDDFVPAMEQIVRESRALARPHAVYLSNACNKYTPRSRRVRGQRLYEATHSRAADSYLVTREACELRLEWLAKNRMTLPIDHQFNATDEAMGIGFYWAEDPIVEQGSSNGRFPSQLDNPHSLRMKKLRWSLDKFYKMHVLRNLS